MTAARPRVLCVDDEPAVLEGLALHLRRGFRMLAASGGAEGLETLAREGPFAVVLSDMRMPGMDGAAFLAKVRAAAPDTVRMLLTGHADMQQAIAAVNEGQIFRFLTKPCPPTALLAALEAACEHHRLVTAERVLLEQTVHGSITPLTDILALVSPAAFGRATRLKQQAGELMARMEERQRWQVEVAAMLSQVACVTLPTQVVEKLHAGRPLSGDEKAMVDRLPDVAERLLANIPRLEGVREILLQQKLAFEPDPASTRPRPCLGARVLRAIVELDVLLTQGSDDSTALDTLRGRGTHDPAVLDLVAELRGSDAPASEIRELGLLALREGMVFAEDVRATSGALLIARGHEVTVALLERIRHFRPGFVAEPVRVLVPGTPAAAGRDGCKATAHV
jgi:response regulator RpfG family c-di-GMP phosphodiesterase